MEGSSTSEPNIQDLFEKDRFPKKGWQILTLLLYSPLGLCLATVRLFILAQAYAALIILINLNCGRSVFTRVIGAVLGIVLYRENENGRDSSAKVIISNKVTCLDNIAIFLTSGAFSWDLPSPLAWVLGVLDTTDGRRPIFSKMKYQVDNFPEPMLLQPEEATTSGKVGLLKFAPWTAKFSDTMQPLVIEVWRPTALETSVDVLGSSLFFDVFWFFFTPFTVFKLKYLPVITRKANESDEDLLGRIQSTIACELGICATRHTAADKVSSCFIQCNILIFLIGSTYYPIRHTKQSQQFCVIGRTHSVDLTISNILEESVPFAAIQEPHRPQPVQPAAVPRPSSQPVVQSVSQGGQGKMISFVERKAKLIADARRKYIEKHGLVDAWAE
ncbi:lipid droplet-regulating VLDL assembly factor AUP1 [Nilaparvata lugens]|uniref:lipid droplet-regulating VLDL assembly factor AUP1 n=1 Tax=Nilaparvata lugens TaxID=108931 RepID=UPI00193E215A|nr:lipid droplet-regulating VLDL assembly factor AUP1 [Nilaparvata lugens]